MNIKLLYLKLIIESIEKKSIFTIIALLLQDDKKGAVKKLKV